MGIKADIRFAGKALRRTPGLTTAVVLTLALGIGATTAMVSLLDAALRQDLPFAEPDRLLMGRATFGGNINPLVSFPDYLDYREQVGSLASLATISAGANTVTVTGAGEPLAASVTAVTGNLFATLGVRPQLGASFSIDEQPPSGAGEVVISHAFWQRAFGGARAVVGSTLRVDGAPLIVTGVMPAGFRFLYDNDLWVPPWPGNSDPLTRRFHNWLLVGRLRPGVALETARREADVVSARLRQAYPESNQDKALQLDELQGVLVEGYRRTLLLLTGAVVLVLLIACANVASLLLARASDRTAELSVRAALGAGRARLARQLLVECTLLAVAGGVVGVGLALVLQRLLLGLASLNLPADLGGLSPATLMIALLVTAATVVLFGAYPSLSTAAVNPAEHLKDAGRRTSSHSGIRFRSGLVVLQVAVSLVLLVPAALLLTSFARLRSVDPGFRVDNILTATISLPADGYQDPERRTRFFESVAAGIRALPGVESVGFTSNLPIVQRGGNYSAWNAEAPPEPGTQPPWVDRRVVLPGYLETLAIPLLAGRLLDDTDAAGSPPAVVLSRTTAEQLFPGQSAVGRRLASQMDQDEPLVFEVVGVVDDFRGWSLAGPARRTMFIPYAQLPERRMRLAVSGSDPLRLTRSIQARVREVDPDVLLTDVRTLADGVARSIASERSIAVALGLFAATALALAIIGLYGVLAFFVSRRRHEIGLRVALGATGHIVLRLVILRGFKLAALGAAAGLLAALWSTTLVAELLFQTRPLEPAILAGVTGLLLLVALAACLLPAWRAVKLTPLEALRAE